MSIEASLAIEHLLLRLRPLNRALQLAVERQSQFASRLLRPDVTPLCITKEQVANLLNSVDEFVKDWQESTASFDLKSDEEEALHNLGNRAAQEGVKLPLDQMAHELSLDSFEQEAVLLSAAPELDRSYERIYAYILDDLNRRFPCIELLSSITARSVQERLVRRLALGRHGRLRRLGLLQAYGEAPTELRQTLRLAPGVLELLVVPATSDFRARFHDPADVDDTELIELAPHIDSNAVTNLGRAVAQKSVSAVGVWGSHESECEDVVQSIALAAGRPLRRLLIEDLCNPGTDFHTALPEALHTAVALDAVLWIPTQQFVDAEQRRFGDRIADTLARSDIPICLSGKLPWRPTALLKTRRYVEFTVARPDYQSTRAMWMNALPDVDETRIDDLATRFRLPMAEMRTVAQVARTRAQLASNGRCKHVEDTLEEACAVVARKDSSHFGAVVEPKRCAEDLVLPSNVHQQVLEISRFFRASPRVDELWGFGRVLTGRGGIKVLFTGDSGTGKTLAAEVIAGDLNLPLFKVDLARVVSKWVGETEKNLDTVFREAEESHSVLFFDEADALFGKRGEVQHGTDRYANLEVGYLLQRLEDYQGLVILASNLKDQIDAAFTRRFQVVIHFPRPGPNERRRIWEIVLPGSAPVDSGVDFGVLERLDMTGAGIASAARMAALLAASGEVGTIDMDHIVEAVSRQYRREARVLTATELGPYARTAGNV